MYSHESTDLVRLAASKATVDTALLQSVSKAIYSWTAVHTMRFEPSLYQGPISQQL
jgi:hypothetical protein